MAKQIVTASVVIELPEAEEMADALRDISTSWKQFADVARSFGATPAFSITVKRKANAGKPGKKAPVLKPVA